jgi:hypothetical protein
VTDDQRRPREDRDVPLSRGIWNIVYYATLLGRIDERTRLITGV